MAEACKTLYIFLGTQKFSLLAGISGIVAGTINKNPMQIYFCGVLAAYSLLPGYISRRMLCNLEDKLKQEIKAEISIERLLYATTSLSEDVR